MASSEIVNVCRYLSEKQINISSSNEWLVACIQWFLSENADSNLATIQKFVYDQLLLADLNVVAQSCLPLNINECGKLKLQGIYFLQINYFIDVGQSAFSQYKKILKVTEVDEDQEPCDEKRYWEKQPNRMLKMEMTDGVNKVYGMEYSSIPKLKSDILIPGVKVLVKGPVEFRDGVLILQDRNVVVLGGEVDSLFEINHTNRCIAKKLNLDENLIPIEVAEQDAPIVLNNVQPIEQNHPTMSHEFVNSNQNRAPRSLQQNDDLFEDSDIFLNVSIDNLLENDNVTEPERCEPPENNMMELQASVVAFKTKLLLVDGNWSLKVKLNTNKGILKAFFDPDLLDKLIGFSPSELSLRKAEFSVNPAIKEKLDKMLECRQRMIRNLDCCMTLRKSNDNELPIIIAISDESAFSVI